MPTTIKPSAAVAVTLAPYANLTVTEVTALDRIIGDPADLTVAWKVKNVGTGPGLVPA